jgi:hypothetical protein
VGGGGLFERQLCVRFLDLHQTLVLLVFDNFSHGSLLLELQLILIGLSILIQHEPTEHILLPQLQLFQKQLSGFLKAHRLYLCTLPILQIQNTKAAINIIGQLSHCGPYMPILESRVVDDFFYRVDVGTSLDEVGCLGVVVVL